MVWHGMAWHGLVWFGVAWCGVAWCGVASCGMVWHSIACSIVRVYVITIIMHSIILNNQVWVTKENVGKKLEDIPIPFSDVKNILDEIHFEDDLTRSRCRGWLVLPSRRYLQADILFPGCEFDCRLTIRGRTGMT